MAFHVTAQHTVRLLVYRFNVTILSTVCIWILFYSILDLLCINDTILKYFCLTVEENFFCTYTPPQTQSVYIENCLKLADIM